MWVIINDFFIVPPNNQTHYILLVFIILQPRPIVDTIQEHEKYGNTGDKFYPIGRAIVNGYEGFSNLLNKLLDVSFSADVFNMPI